jgi:hypothetical protein
MVSEVAQTVPKRVTIAKPDVAPVPAGVRL